MSIEFHESIVPLMEQSQINALRSRETLSIVEAAFYMGTTIPNLCKMLWEQGIVEKYGSWTTHVNRADIDQLIANNRRRPRPSGVHIKVKRRPRKG
jgi:hypothetical protein